MHIAKAWMLTIMLTLLIFLPGCAAVGLTMLGVGASIAASNAVSYSLNGIAYRTFSSPVSDVNQATLASLDDMGFEIVKKQKNNNGETIIAKGYEREITVNLEPISAKGTRMRTSVNMGSFFKDRATATEIIIQTEKKLG